MAVSRILVCVSSPWASERLAPIVRDLAERLNASVIVTHVVRASEQDQSEDEPRQRGQQAVSTLTSHLATVKVAADGLLLYGSDVARALLNAIEAQNATVIVMGQSGKGRLTRLLGGDITHQLLRQARVPVLLCPSDWSGTV